MAYFWTALGIIFIFFMTSLGAFVALLPQKDKRSKRGEIFLAFAGGVMLAAALFSLLLKALELAQEKEGIILLPLVSGILVGAIFILIFDIILQRNSKNNNENARRAKKLFFAMTIHNIPEGLSVGLSFGIALMNIDNEAALIAPLLLALGIGIQNFPEGISASLPMLEATNSKKKACLLGIFSGVVEPIAAVIGLILASYLQSFMPFVLSFGAGAMIYVVIDELIITKGNSLHKLITNIAFLLGFLVMMSLDIILG